MRHRLNALGLVLMVALAISSISTATSAQAQNGKLTSTGKITLTGTEITPTKWTVFGITIECPGSTYTGHQVGSPTAFLPSGSEEATITPHYVQPCRTNFGPATLDVNGCDFVVHLGGTTGVADTYAVTYDIVCPAGKDITGTVWFTESEHKEGKEACTVHVPAQTGLKGGTIKDTTEGDLILGGSITGITAGETKDNLHPLLCPAKEGTGALDVNITVKGDNEAGPATSISLSHL